MISSLKELNLLFTCNEILKVCKQLNNGKAAGSDCLLNEFFKYGVTSEAFINVLCSLFNKYFEMGYFPESWSEGLIVPIHKKGYINDVQNYRGITLLSTMGKLFTKLINCRLNKWAEDYHVYIEAQAGFRQQMGIMIIFLFCTV